MGEGDGLLVVDGWLETGRSGDARPATTGKVKTMKKLVCVMMVAAVAAGVQAADPAAPYHGYGPAMASTEEKPLTAVWQEKNRAALAKATSDEALGSVVAEAASARALLAKVKGAYTTDPLTLTEIAAVTQWVMAPESGLKKLNVLSRTRAAGRKVWVKALLETAETTSDAYVKMFCLDQLRWCGCSCPRVSARVQAIGAKSGDKALKEMADLVVRTLAAK